MSQQRASPRQLLGHIDIQVRASLKTNWYTPSVMTADDMERARCGVRPPCSARHLSRAHTKLKQRTRHPYLGRPSASVLVEAEFLLSVSVSAENGAVEKEWYISWGYVISVAASLAAQQHRWYSTKSLSRVAHVLPRWPDRRDV